MNRSVRAELDIEKLKMDAEHLQYERDEVEMTAMQMLSAVIARYEKGKI